MEDDSERRGGGEAVDREGMRVGEECDGLNGQRNGVECMEVEGRRNSGVSSGSLNVGGVVAARVRISSSTESRRPPQQYTGMARVAILGKLKREVVRFRTFQNWTSSAMQPNILAKAGFFYFNDMDRVQCAFCLGIIGQWVCTDDPFVDHKRHFPRCSFILGLPVGNVPIDVATGRERIVVREIVPGLDVTGIRPEVRVNAESERGLWIV